VLWRSHMISWIVLSRLLLMLWLIQYVSAQSECMFLWSVTHTVCFSTVWMYVSVICDLVLYHCALLLLNIYSALPLWAICSGIRKTATAYPFVNGVIAIFVIPFGRSVFHTVVWRIALSQLSVKVFYNFQAKSSHVPALVSVIYHVIISLRTCTQ
jgi:hypothetical protein